MRDAQGAAKLAAPYQSQIVLNRYTVQTGTVNFNGATVSGEFRELCGVQGGIDSVPVVDEVSAQCLPKLLKKEGYKTTAIHGYLGSMFDRKTWYRNLGFDDIEFLEDLRGRPGVRTCGGSVPGICDADVARLLDHNIASSADSGPQFYYWLTLNSHLPVATSNENAALFACSTLHAANSDPSICAWMALIYKVNLAVAELSLDPRLPPTEIIIVGDHAPPFLTSKRRAQFSQDVVPYIHLVPRKQSRDAIHNTNNLVATAPMPIN
jgi:phosphoglycerol transferase MdoB-like AlkP superfamily enzyme